MPYAMIVIVDTKCCPRCKVTKPITEFPAKKDRRCGTYCLPCKQDYDRDYYAATSDIRARQKQQRKVVIKERNRLFVLEHLSKAGGCADCGETDL